ncbi:unnamed protein product [Cylicocyclus nassatus]|uniref:Uncharacterized protein n=1 Tax=Cylicocyclus nassatus TaxID=53992 RepID=A0AA36HGE8_CYLNA|nr:unnamed protein product [Cylicocyclus nassatus]
MESMSICWLIKHAQVLFIPIAFSYFIPLLYIYLLYIYYVSSMYTCPGYLSKNFVINWRLFEVILSYCYCYLFINLIVLITSYTRLVDITFECKYVVDVDFEMSVNFVCTT